MLRWLANRPQAAPSPATSLGRKGRAFGLERDGRVKEEKKRKNRFPRYCRSSQAGTVDGANTVTDKIAPQPGVESRRHFVYDARAPWLMIPAKRCGRRSSDLTPYLGCLVSHFAAESHRLCVADSISGRRKRRQIGNSLFWSPVSFANSDSIFMVLMKFH